MLLYAVKLIRQNFYNNKAETGYLMFLTLWNYIRGYVIIYITGFSVERFINLAVNHGIFIWDVYPEKNRVIMKARTGNIQALKDCCIKTGCKLEVVGEYGLPVFLKKCVLHKAYVGGVLGFTVVMYIMSSFIWTVNVEGTERINPEDIITSCKQKGIAPGKLKKGLDLYEIGKSLMVEYNDISWIAINMKGTGVVVNIVETIPKTQFVEREKPTDVIAEHDGKIVSIVQSSGTPVVKVGDEVKKGDVLISNVIALKDGTEQVGEKSVCASGEVYAEKNYELEGTSPLIYNEKVFTDKTKTDYSLYIGDKVFDFIRPSDIIDFEKVIDDKYKIDIGDYTVPFGINKTVYGQVKTEEKRRTEKEAETLAQKQLEDKITALTMEYGAEVTALDTEISTDGLSVTAKGYLTVVMRIDKQQEVENINYREVME